MRTSGHEEETQAIADCFSRHSCVEVAEEDREEVEKGRPVMPATRQIWRKV
jgi:hypothetical protein